MVYIATGLHLVEEIMSADFGSIYISAATMGEMIEFDLSRPGKETAGLLIGEIVGKDLYVDEIHVGAQVGNAVHVEINEETLIAATIEMSEREDGKVIIGWFHTHPGMSSFMSPTDVHTQKIYQAFFPEAIAIVIDPVKFSETNNIEDLDFGVYRLVNGKSARIKYEVSNALEFALNTYLASDKVVVHQKTRVPAKQSETKYIGFTPIMSLNRLKLMKYKVDRLMPDMDQKDAKSLQAWIELAEAMQDGAITEVPVDVVKLNENMDSVMYSLEDSLDELDDLWYEQRAVWALFGSFFGILLLALIFYFFII
jgi:proteasome lid subunit RPN8/RPN11